MNRHSDEHVARIYNDIEGFPGLMDVAEELGWQYTDVKNWVEKIRRRAHRGEETVEVISRANKTVAGSKRERLIEDVRDVARGAGSPKVSRRKFDAETHNSEADIQVSTGTFQELKRQANLEPTRGARQISLDAARHASLDHLNSLNESRLNYGEKYLRDKGRKYKTIIGANDLHDIEIDPFWLRVFLDTCKRVQPDAIVLNGDIFDLPEFGRFHVDPREWDAAGRIKFAHEKILGPLREICPDAQIDFIEGNHEYRLVRLMGEAAPGLQALLSDLHGWDVSRLFGLDKFEINYIAKGDLKTFTKSDATKELAKNYKIYHGCILAHHFPNAESFGLPGWNGHHHSHRVKQSFSPTYGSYEWHQFGCGHRREATYCNGEVWGMGFGIINLNSETLTTNFDYIPVTDFAVAGGKFYEREGDEVYGDRPLLTVRK